MNAKQTIIGVLCLCTLASAIGRGLAREVRSTTSSSSATGVSVSTVNGETVITANGRELYRGPTRGAVTSVSRSENGVEYSAVMDGDRVLWESSPGAAGKLPSGGRSGGGGGGSAGGGGGIGSGTDPEASMAEHEANFEKMVREMQQQAGSSGSFRSSGSQSGSTRSGTRSIGGSGARSSAGGSASAGGSSGGFSSGSASGSGSGRAGGGGTSNASGNGSSAGFGTGASSLQPGMAGGSSLRGTAPRPVTPSAPPSPRKRTPTNPAPEEASVTFKVVDGSSVVVFRGREYSVGPTHERLTGKSWIADGKEYATAQEGDRVIWENVPGAARQLVEINDR